MIKRLTQFFDLFFRPPKFVTSATQKVVDDEFNTNKQLLSAFPDKDLPPERLIEFKKAQTQSTTILRAKIGNSFIVTLSTLLIALFTKSILDHYRYQFSPKILAIISTFLILWAIFGYAGWEIQTAGGTTLPEEINKSWYAILQAIGIYLLFLAILSSP